MAGPGAGSVVEIRPVGAWVPRVSAPPPAANAAAPAEPALAGHAVAAAAPAGPRNPVIRALANFGRLIARCFTRSEPMPPRALTPVEQAALLLSSFLRDVMPPRPRKPSSQARTVAADRKAARRIAEDLRRLA